MHDLPGLFGTTVFLVVGAQAANRYMPPRFTADIDVLIPANAADEVAAKLQASGATHREPLAMVGMKGTTWTLRDGARLDVLEGEQPWLEEALASPQRGQDGTPYIALPYLVLMKLEAGRLSDAGDLGRMLGGASENALADVRAAVSKYMPQAGEDLESLITLGKLERGS